MFDIKKLKPNKNSVYKQGYINPATCKKLFESLKYTPIIYRSSLEKKFIYFCESSNQIKKWGSECIRIPYFDIYKNKERTYFPDYVIEMINGDKILIEIKPYSQTHYPDRVSQWALEQWLTNKQKWSSAIEWCNLNNYKFQIITEKFFKDNV